MPRFEMGTVLSSGTRKSKIIKAIFFLRIVCARPGTNRSDKRLKCHHHWYWSKNLICSAMVSHKVGQHRLVIWDGPVSR